MNLEQSRKELIRNSPRILNSLLGVTLLGLTAFDTRTSQYPISSEQQSTPASEFTIKNGRLMRGNNPDFIRTGWAFINFGPHDKPVTERCAVIQQSTQELIECMDHGQENFNAIVNYPKKLKELGFNAMEVVISPDQFDPKAEGRITDPRALENLNRLIEAISREDMLLSLRFVNYTHDAGGPSREFYRKYPDAIALNEKGNKVYGSPYRTTFPGTRPGINEIDKYKPVISIYNENFLQYNRDFIVNVLRSIDTSRLVLVGAGAESSYSASADPENPSVLNNMIDFSDAAKKVYEQKGGVWPPADIHNPYSRWNIFRAEYLAEFEINNARIIKSVVGDKSLIATGHLVAPGDVYRKGNSLRYLEHLSELDDGSEKLIDVIELNWSGPGVEDLLLRLGEKGGSALDNFKVVNSRRSRKWLSTEHMTYVPDGSKQGDIGAALDYALTYHGRGFIKIFNTRPVQEDFNHVGAYDPTGKTTYGNSWTIIGSDWQVKRPDEDLLKKAEGQNTPMSYWTQMALTGKQRIYLPVLAKQSSLP